MDCANCQFQEINDLLVIHKFLIIAVSALGNALAVLFLLLSLHHSLNRYLTIKTHEIYKTNRMGGIAVVCECLLGGIPTCATKYATKELL